MTLDALADDYVEKELRWGGCLSVVGGEVKGKPASLLHLVLQHGRRWEITDVHPIDLVRQRGGCRSIPRVLSVHDMRLILGELTDPYRTMVLMA